MLHSFSPEGQEDTNPWFRSGVNSDGAGPSAPLVQGADGALYGSTVAGGAGGSGTLFRVTPQGQLTTLHEFSVMGEAFDNADGARMFAPLAVGDDGNLYGVTQTGGPQGGGVAFRVSPAGNFTVLHDFPFGNAPAGLTKGADGAFYGATFHGGVNGNGSIFKITPAGVLTTLYSFGPVICATPTVCSNSDGALPEAPLAAGSDGNFYGSTSIGGANGTGVLFKVTPLGVLTVLHAFDAITTDPNGGTTCNSDGYSPGSALVEDAAGSFLGTAYRGGSYGQGTIFRVTSAGAFSVAHTFDGFGSNPLSGLTRAQDGNFYGIGTVGFLQSVFKLTPEGAFTPVFVQGADEAGSPEFPTDTLLQLADGTFYGTSRGGGDAGSGTLFTLNLDADPAVWLSSVPYTSPPTGPGDLFVVYWDSANVTQCVASGGGTGDGWDGRVLNPSDSLAISEQAAGTYTFTIQCSGPDGDTTDSTVVEIAGPAIVPEAAMSGHGDSGAGGGLDPWALGIGLLAALRRRRLPHC